MDDILFSTLDNPVPDNHTAGFFEGAQKMKLRYALFRSKISPARGTVVLLQGRNEFIEKYYETIRDLNAMGLWVATFDLRGQGGSQRLLKDPRKGHVRRFSDYERDLSHFLEHVVLPDARLPFFLVAHSTGALIALSAAPMLSNRIDRMALAAPFVGLAHESLSQAGVLRLSTVLSRIGLGATSMGKDHSQRAFAGNPLTSDRARFDRNAALMTARPDLTIGPPTARWLYETLTAAERASQQAHLTRVTIPTLILAPMLDGVVPYLAQERLSRNFRAGQLITLTGARHELFQERDLFRAQALAAIEAFMPGSEPMPDVAEGVA
ncbi:alpha/beta fold hydrolase [Rhizobium sp. SSA_523]|uniref:alpha/beta fold hydrolase n=1 Tax=Rhizobium sp. SSA_523 TaxID=2952477 RepID=UPI0020903518|nr:alpha/beta hydrolase [Rhizobium sp. SSA_523]MCO5731875.1 alpha/beta hydrolase [Rhizobium sp. SSA_523]WKC22766.1 alpha/beta hydrolase [Rhizobium sp. SSA_523]